MARAIWQGQIAFGLVTIPVGLHTAVREDRIRLHLLSEDGSCRLRRKLFCPETGEEFDFSETVRGYEVAPDQYVVVNTDEIEALEPEDGRDIEIVQFVNASEVDPMYFNRPYYLLPQKGAERAYSLLVKALERSGKVGVSQFTMRDRDYVGTLRVKDDLIVLETMYYHNELVVPEELPSVKPSRVPDKEEKLALTLIETLTGKFKPEKFKNEFNERMEKLIDMKKKGKTPARSAKKSKSPGKVLDLAGALAASLKKRGKSEDSAQSSTRKSSDKKTAKSCKASSAKPSKKSKSPTKSSAGKRGSSKGSTKSSKAA